MNSFTMKMEILLEPTSNKLMVEHAEYDESNTYVLERFNTTTGNPVKKILLQLNLSDHRILKDGGGVKEVQRSFRHSDTERLSRSDEVLKLKNFKKDATLKLSKSTNQERVNLSESWTHFKNLLQKVPYHGIDLWLQVQIVYDRIDQSLKRTVDYTAKGRLRKMSAEKAWATIEGLA
ncbi:hypothetical protein Tco_0783344 [Tanacetum coccineum]